MRTLSLSRFADEASEIMPVIAREFFRRQEGGFLKVTITPPQMIVLDTLHKRGESSMSDLAAALKVTTAAMTGVTDRLVRDGYVVRSHDLRDRRVIRISLRPKGEKAVRMLAARRKQMVMKMFGALTEKERDQYLRILKRIREALAAESCA